MREKQQASEALMREILGDNYLELKVEHLTIEEDIAAGTCNVKATIAPTTGQVEQGRRNVQGQGVGLIDAFFRGLIEQYSVEYRSLKTIRFVGFAVTGMLDKNRPRGASGSDALGEVRLVVENNDGHEFEFLAASRSITASAMQATLDAAEYFINSERAFLTTRHALNDARARNRSDLVQKFAARLAELVQNTSYSEAIEAAQKGRA